MSISRQGIITSNDNGLKDVYNGIYTNGDLPIYVNATFMTKTLHNYYTNYRFQITKPTSNSWYYWDATTFDFDVGSTYLWKCSVRCNQCTAGVNAVLRASRSANDWVTNGVQIINPTLADGKWHEYYRTQTVNSTYERSSTTITCAPLFEIYTSNLASATTDTIIVDFDICNIQVIKASENKPMGAFFELDDNPASIGKDFIRAVQFYEI